MSRGKFTSAIRAPGALNVHPEAVQFLLLYFGYPLQPEKLIGMAPMRFVVLDDQSGEDDATDEPTA